MPRVTFLHPEGRNGEIPHDASLLEAAEFLGFPLAHDCGGNASCTTCRVEVECMSASVTMMAMIRSCRRPRSGACKPMPC